MTVQEFIIAFVSQYATIRVINFHKTDAAARVLYEGIARLDNIPDDVRMHIVSSIVAVSNDLYIAVYKEDKQ